MRWAAPADTPIGLNLFKSARVYATKHQSDQSLAKNASHALESSKRTPYDDLSATVAQMAGRPRGFLGRCSEITDLEQALATGTE